MQAATTRAVLAVSVVAAAAVASAAHADGVLGPQNHETVKKVVSEPVHAVQVRNDAGRVRILTGETTTVVGDESWNTQQPTLDVSVADGVLTVRSVCDTPTSTPVGDIDVTSFLNQCSDRLTLVVPSDVRVNVRTFAGSVETKGIRGRQMLHTGAGGVAVSNGAGALAASTGTGPISLTNVTGRSVDAHTGGGSITLDGVRAPAATLHTGTGPITATLQAAVVSATSGGGAVTVTDTDAPRNLYARTGTGPVTANVPSGAYDVDATSGTGKKRVTVKGVVVDPESPRSITVHTGGGDATVAGHGSFEE